MKILVITLEYPPQIGGIATYVSNLVSHTLNDEIIIYAPDVDGAKEYDKKEKFKVYRGRPYWKFFWPRWGKLFFDIWNIVKKENIEKVYIHHALPVGYVVNIIKRIKKIPFVLFLHGTDLELGIKFKKNKLTKICQSAESIVVNSNFLKEKLNTKLKQDFTEKIIVLYPSPSDIFFKEVSEEKKEHLRSQLALEGKKVILTVARMSDGKGYPHMLNILPDILKTIPNLVWIIVGDGEKKDSILDYIRKNNLQNIVRFVGNISHEELPVFYQLADLFVLLTHKDEVSEEGWGTVFLEAGVSGLPVIAGRAGGVEEAVQNNITGLVLNIYEKKKLIENIEKLLSDKELSLKMGLAGKERINSEFTWDKQILKLK